MDLCVRGIVWILSRTNRQNKSAAPASRGYVAEFVRIHGRRVTCVGTLTSSATEQVGRASLRGAGSLRRGACLESNLGANRVRELAAAFQLDSRAIAIDGGGARSNRGIT